MYLDFACCYAGLLGVFRRYNGSPPPPPPPGVSVAKHRAPVLQTCGLGRASSDTSKNFRFEVQTCSWKTVIGASCPLPRRVTGVMFF